MLTSVNLNFLVQYSPRSICMIKLRVREVAESKGYNMSSLSRAADISFTTIKRLWTKPYSGANINTLSKIAKVLDVSISELTEEVPDKN